MNRDVEPGRWGPAASAHSEHSKHSKHSEHSGLDPRTRTFAETRLGPAVSAPPPGQPMISAPRISVEQLAEMFPGIEVATDDDTRLRASRGMSYANMVSWRSEREHRAPDAVVSPASHEQALAVVGACSAGGIACVPVGGGTSVTGGIDTPAFTAVIAISTDRLNAIENLDEESGVVTVGSGVTGPALEEFLGARGWTLGHFPQSFERASVGGYIAARSSGQSSGGYGRIEDMLVAADVATPIGSWTVGGYPASSSGPDLRHVVLGSEGSLGVVTRAQLRVRRAPSVREYRAALVPGGFHSAVRVVQQLTRSPLRPTVLRVSDPAETEALLTMSMPSGLVGRAFSAYVRARRALPGSLVIVGFESDLEETVRASRAFASDVLADAGAVSLGARPGKSWVAGRFHGPYLRDALMDGGYLVETFETVVLWSEVNEVHRILSDVVRRELGDSSYVMAHISHSYDVGASLYFTVLAGGWNDPDMAATAWRRVKSTLMDVIHESGAAVSHHHGVGRDHRDWLAGQIGDVGIGVLRSVKAYLDPAGVMNPGALLDSGERGVP